MSAPSASVASVPVPVDQIQSLARCGALASVHARDGTLDSSGAGGEAGHAGDAGEAGEAGEAGRKRQKILDATYIDKFVALSEPEKPVPTAFVLTNDYPSAVGPMVLVKDPTAAGVNAALEALFEFQLGSDATEAYDGESCDKDGESASSDANESPYGDFTIEAIYALPAGLPKGKRGFSGGATHGVLRDGHVWHWAPESLIKSREAKAAAAELIVDNKGHYQAKDQCNACFKPATAAQRTCGKRPRFEHTYFGTADRRGCKFPSDLFQADNEDPEETLEARLEHLSQ